MTCLAARSRTWRCSTTVPTDAVNDSNPGRYTAGAGSAAGAFQPARAQDDHGGTGFAWLALWGVLGVSVLIRCSQAILNPMPQHMQSAVGNAIMSLITLDAVLVLAFCGEQWAVTVLALLVWFVLGRRIAAVT